MGIRDSIEKRKKKARRDATPSKFPLILTTSFFIVNRLIMVASIAAVALLSGIGCLQGVLAADEFKIESRDDIIASSRDLAHDLMTFYKGNQTGEIPGILPGPPPSGDYYFGEGAHFWTTIIDYWRITGDDTYNALALQGIQHQLGPNDDFLAPNWTLSLGNDDQCGWAMTAIRAAEAQFPSLSADGATWISLAQTVFNQLASRYRTEVEGGHCGGGLRWQIALANLGYDYKNCTSLPLLSTVIILCTALTMTASILKHLLLHPGRPPGTLHGQHHLLQPSRWRVRLARHLRHSRHRKLRYLRRWTRRGKLHRYQQGPVLLPGCLDVPWRGVPVQHRE